MRCASPALNQFGKHHGGTAFLYLSQHIPCTRRDLINEFHDCPIINHSQILPFGEDNRNLLLFKRFRQRTVNRSFEFVRLNQCTNTTGYSAEELTPTLRVSRVYDF